MSYNKNTVDYINITLINLFSNRDFFPFIYKLRSAALKTYSFNELINICSYILNTLYLSMEITFQRYIRIRYQKRY